MTNKLKFNLGIPDNGWLNVKLIIDEFKLEFESSDVPNNPIIDLIHAIINLILGKKSEVYWHLEPTAYYFIFEKTSDLLNLKIEFDNNNSRNFVYEVEGSFEMLLEPIIIEIEKFISNGYDDSNWPKTDLRYFEKLSGLLKTCKNCT